MITRWIPTYKDAIESPVRFEASTIELTRFDETREILQKQKEILFVF